jgi:hypothetical protein
VNLQRLVADDHGFPCGVDKLWVEGETQEARSFLQTVGITLPALLPDRATWCTSKLTKLQDVSFGDARK